MQLWSAYINTFFLSERWVEATDLLLPQALSYAIADQAVSKQLVVLWQQNSALSLQAMSAGRLLCSCQQNKCLCWYAVCVPMDATSLCQYGHWQLRCKIGRYSSTYGCSRGEQSVISHLIELNIELLDSEKPDSACFWLIAQFFSPSFMSGSQSPVLFSSKIALLLPAERVSVSWGCRKWVCAFKRGWQK